MSSGIRITEEQAFYAIKNGEFDKDVIASRNNVVVIMTQDWCPQWLHMQTWLYDALNGHDVGLYELLYNKVSYFNEFREFKETVWKNDEIPYLRFYKAGKLFRDSNYIIRERFHKILLDMSVVSI